MRLAIALVCLLCTIATASPREVAGYRRGKQIVLRVVEVGWAEVEVKTARAFERMRAAAERDGIELVIWSGFRSHERQAELYARWRAGWGNMAARPGYSNHQSGRALDLVLGGRTYTWLAANAKRYGFQQTVRSEPWHWEYVGVPRRRR